VWPQNDEKVKTFGKWTEYYMKFVSHSERSFLSITASFGKATEIKRVVKVQPTYMSIEELDR
jgi:hypothetical protein